MRLSKEDFEKPIKEFADAPFFITEFLTLDKLLEEMQRNKRHMAIVVDEYGNTAGLITLDDVLREVVGELPDEKGKEEEFKEIDEDRFLVKGDLPVEELKELLGLEDDEVLEEVDTVSGLVMALTKRIPKEGESVEYQGYRFKVAEKEGNRIKSVVVERLK